MVRINRFRNRIVPAYHFPERDTTDCSNEIDNEFFTSVNDKDHFDSNKSDDFSSDLLETIDESHSFTEFSTIHSYRPFDENDLPTPYSNVFSLDTSQKKSLLHRFDIKSATFALSKRRKFGQCHHNFSYFNLNKKLSKYSFAANNSTPICICVNGKVQVLDENCLEDIIQMFPSFTLSPTTPSTSKISSKYFEHNTKDKNPNDIIYSLSSWLSKEEDERFESLNGLNLVKTIRTTTTTMRSDYKNSGAVMLRTMPRRRHTFARTDFCKVDFNRRHNFYGISHCIPSAEKSESNESCLTTTAVLQAFDSAKFSLTVHEANVSSTSSALPLSYNPTLLDDFKGLSIASNGKTSMELLPDNVITQEAICQQFANMPLSSPPGIAPPPTSPTETSPCDHSLQACGRNDFDLQQYQTMTSGIELSRLKL